MLSTEIWKNLAQALPDAVIGWGDGEVAFINELARSLFELDEESRVSLAELFPEQAEFEKLVTAPPGKTIEIACVTKSGKRFLADARCRKVEGASPELFVCSLREARMSQRDQERYRAAAEMFQLGLFDHDQITDELWGSPGHRALYGLSKDETLTIPRLLQGLHPEDFGLVGPAIARAHDPSGDGVFDVEHRVIWPNGEIRWIRTRSQTEFAQVDGVRRAVRTVGASADQTSRKEAERERERIVSVLEESPDFVAISAPDLSLLYLNRSARALFQVREGEDITKRNLADQHTSHSREVFLEKALAEARHDGVWCGEGTLLGVNGRTVPVSLVVLAHFRADDTLERYAVVARDLTREKELEEQLLHSQKMEALGRVAGGAAHDFNNLLSVIISSTDLALGRLPDESPVRHELDVVLEASRRATDLTQQMLTFSRKSPQEGVIVDVNDVITRMMHILSRLVGKHVELRVRLAPEPGNIKADPGQIEQVVLNLVVNARDAMPKGGVLALETHTVLVDDAHGRTGMKPGAYVVLTVRDSGTGMDASTKSHIFEPFFTTKRVGEGTGLGLSTVFGIVKQSNGSIRVDSELGEGATFEVSFPRIGLPSRPSRSSSSTEEKSTDASDSAASRVHATHAPRTLH
jgi:two-component system cell cycle sensor histidine kinase/response regulator CckA